MKYSILTVLISAMLLSSTFTLKAQEIYSEVQVRTNMQIPESEMQILRTLESSINEFLNNTAFTEDKFLNQERINCNIQINITERPAMDEWKATIQVQATRPVYNSSYNTPLVRIIDRNFNFKYSEYQPIEYIDGVFTNNISSMLSYYVFIVLGLDYDSFSEMGGTPLFQKALSIANGSQGAIGFEGDGWKPNEDRSRHVLVNQLMDRRFENLRRSWYNYHRNGLDLLADRTEQGRATILSSLQHLQGIHRTQPNSYLMSVFFNTKSDEIANVFSKATPTEKSNALSLLRNIDITNINKYEEKLR